MKNKEKREKKNKLKYKEEAREYGGKLNWLFLDPVRDIATVTHILSVLVAKDKGNKEWWKVEGKRKGKKNSQENQKYMDIRQR